MHRQAAPLRHKQRLDAPSPPCLALHNQPQFHVHEYPTSPVHTHKYPTLSLLAELLGENEQTRFHSRALRGQAVQGEQTLLMLLC